MRVVKTAILFPYVSQRLSKACISVKSSLCPICNLTIARMCLSVGTSGQGNRARRRFGNIRYDILSFLQVHEQTKLPTKVSISTSLNHTQLITSVLASLPYFIRLLNFSVCYIAYPVRVPSKASLKVLKLFQFSKKFHMTWFIYMSTRSTYSCYDHNQSCFLIAVHSSHFERAWLSSPEGSWDIKCGRSS